ncbi:putative F-box domain, kelch-type beta propeller, F-box-like domain superfamily [Helianthus annuus]|uniref:F-box domain, kelch-type beta propeller, F-box-like domain superfamily n=2 Tax=Helianthus annuus TaxID=4232 RepID=A0A9K3JHQ7_HELAN|nr:putative F-box domain, kelch-type beta propeller, F-box-like domain superfamily [Helianthus annuus]KAJ0593843.1 putative F-box domain, kelch-type beta propeller, F-box-like domain superfamily [Helianthus annuus]KAJ0608866.1 putative F-box domain, kelch-type beta propeller, F-box-like domain superfamily [Helianthus annuus]KAJ0768907.1 putative F-box domain, kelch-type beta propeller, F-box-like domain superfamily [Helianthus annuus]KAJ0774654.1 putative F-box domain, kelch-type beta propeller
MSSSDDNCNSRHFSWLMKSCFPDTRPDPSLHFSPPPPTTTTISSLPNDVLLEILSCVDQSSLPSISSVCRRWSDLIQSSQFYHLRRCRRLLHLAVFVVSFSDSGLFAANYKLGHDSRWKTTTLKFNNYDDDVVSPVMSSHARLAAIGHWIYIIGKTTVLRCDAWTGSVTPRSKMSVMRKKFALAVVAGKIYAAGGSTRSAAVEEYDPKTNSWRVVSHAPRMRYGCIGAAVDGVLYVIGGLKVGGTPHNIPRASTGSGAHVYASSMDLYDVEARRWLRSRAVPGGGCMVAACSAGDYIYILASHAVELSFWRFNGSRGVGFGEWRRLKSPPLPMQIRLDGTVRFGCVGVGEMVVLIQIMGCIDDLLRRSGRSTRGVKEALVLVYDSGEEEWSRAADLPDVVRRAACVCVEWVTEMTEVGKLLSA